MRASHPVWVRGLKHCFQGIDTCIKLVAPRVGAWIETEDNQYDQEESLVVAPRVGAWIETGLQGGLRPICLSHPVWVRGLKQSRVRELQEEQKVAPRVGAWIETQQPELLKNREASHPVWVRGLKR